MGRSSPHPASATSLLSATLVRALPAPPGAADPPGAARARDARSSPLPSCVMQMEPQPMPTRRPSTPASVRCLACAAVTTVDPTGDKSKGSREIPGHRARGRVQGPARPALRPGIPAPLPTLQQDPLGPWAGRLATASRDGEDGQGRAGAGGRWGAVPWATLCWLGQGCSNGSGQAGSATTPGPSEPAPVPARQALAPAPPRLSNCPSSVVPSCPEQTGQGLPQLEGGPSAQGRAEDPCFHQPQ